jgi:hypothetical protein
MSEIISLGVIMFVLIAGFLMGAICVLITNIKQNEALRKEVDKFRDLYFEEMDKWRNKYVNDDYEAY